MHPFDRLAENRLEQGVAVIRPGPFHVVEPLVGRMALQNELARVGVFALVALERHREQPQANGRGGRDRDKQGQERAQSAADCGDEGRTGATGQDGVLWRVAGSIAAHASPGYQNPSLPK